MKSYFITGTDTDVGKTFVTCALVHSIKTRGLRVAPMKPIAAGRTNIGGVDMNEDVAALCEVAESSAPARDINPYCFSEPIAPHLAAQHENTAVEMAVIRAAFARLAAGADTVLVEGAGGFLVPLSADQSMAEIPVALGLDVILVVSMRLGVLNHALLTAEAIRSRGLTLAGWVANCTVPGTVMAAFDENIATLKQMLDAPFLGIVPYDVKFDGTLERARRASAHLQISSLMKVN